MSDPQTPPSPQPAPKWTGSAIALVVIGLLILIPSGLCTSVFGLAGLFDSSGYGGYDGFMLGMALIVGGPFIILGALLIRTGLRERRRG